MDTKHPLKSKTIHGGLVAIGTGLALALGAAEMEPPKTIDELDKPQDHTKQMVGGLVAMGAGGMAIKGRFDAKTQLKRKGDKL